MVRGSERVAVLIGRSPDEPRQARLAPRHPPLSCRTSPPQGGRSDAATAFANRQRCKTSGKARAANLPPCGGDGRQARGGCSSSTSRPSELVATQARLDEEQVDADAAEDDQE